jgi:hypothetical protein
MIEKENGKFPEKIEFRIGASISCMEELAGLKSRLPRAGSRDEGTYPTTGTAESDRKLRK